MTITITIAMPVFRRCTPEVVWLPEMILLHGTHRTSYNGSQVKTQDDVHRAAKPVALS